MLLLTNLVETALMWAVKNGYTEMCELLIPKMSNAAMNRIWLYCLNLGCKEEHKEAMSLLISNDE